MKNNLVVLNCRSVIGYWRRKVQCVQVARVSIQVRIRIWKMEIKKFIYVPKSKTDRIFSNNY